MTKIASRDLDRLAGLKLVTKHLSPAYFAMVMATGIVLIAAFLLGMVSVAVILFAVNITAYLVLGLLIILRHVWFPRAFLFDLVDHQRGPGFLTFVAGSCVLGSQFILIADNYDVALGDSTVDNFDLRHLCNPVREGT